jgi:hypothetical protein
MRSLEEVNNGLPDELVSKTTRKKQNERIEKWKNFAWGGFPFFLRAFCSFYTFTAMVFLSYAREDIRHAEKLYMDLRIEEIVNVKKPTPTGVGSLNKYYDTPRMAPARADSQPLTGRSKMACISLVP